MDETTNAQLLLATRIHHALLRHLGSGIDVGAMLTREGYAREVLYVCEGCGDAELKALGEQFKRARPPLPAPRPAEPPTDEAEEGDDEFEPFDSAPGEPSVLARRRTGWLQRAAHWWRRRR
jgi:hypothetical protein